MEETIVVGLLSEVGLVLLLSLLIFTLKDENDLIGGTMSYNTFIHMLILFSISLLFGYVGYWEFYVAFLKTNHAGELINYGSFALLGSYSLSTIALDGLKPLSHRVRSVLGIYHHTPPDKDICEVTSQ